MASQTWPSLSALTPGAPPPAPPPPPMPLPPAPPMPLDDDDDIIVLVDDVSSSPPSPPWPDGLVVLQHAAIVVPRKNAANKLVFMVPRSFARGASNAPRAV